MRPLVWVCVLAGACGGAPLPPEPAPEAPAPAPARGRGQALRDPCAPEAGRPPPEPLKKQYVGLAAKARCQAEVGAIMVDVTHALGVECAHCHDARDYSKPTHRMQIANWMARELVPTLAKQNGSAPLCNDCHAGKAKILGQPRDARWAREWMATHLVEELERSDGGPLRCKSCHRGNPGTPEFQARIILTDRLPRSAEPPSPDAGLPAGGGQLQLE